MQIEEGETPLAMYDKQLIGFITVHDPDAEQLKDFYGRCLKFNKRPGGTEQLDAANRR